MIIGDVNDNAATPCSYTISSENDNQSVLFQSPQMLRKSWNPKQPSFNGCLVKQPFLFNKDLESSH